MMNQMGRIIHTVPAISEEASGPSYAVVRLCESLISEGDAVTLSTLDWAPMDSPPAFVKRFPLGLGPRRLGRSPAMRRWLTKAVADREVRLIHNHSLWMMPNVYPGWIAKKSDIPLIVSPHGTLSDWAMRNGSPVKQLFWPLLQRPVLNATTCFHATAKSEYEDIRRLGFKQAVAMIPIGIDIPEWNPKQQSEFRTLLFLGRIHPKKGLDLLLPAWGAVQNRFPDWRLKIVGPDNDGHLQRMQQLAKELGLERIVFTGALLGREKREAYRDADLFVLPTHSENFGISVTEALAGGTPAIVTKGAPWQGLEEHQAGWWVDISVDALVACLESALNQPHDELEAMGLRGRSWMEADFSWQRIGKQMVQTYRWMIDGGTPPEWVWLDGV
ncbi:MAG: glycosyltransferase [Methylococcaceae bacterium]|nr:glycosyltransferase [Methylococcaceae bacterium]